MHFSLKNALPIIARYFCDDLGVQLIHGGTQACTWDKKIYLPLLKEKEGVNKLALGYVAHESAHIKYSTQDVYSMASQEAPFVVKFMNVLEDIRIENLMMRQHCTVRDWLSHTVKEVLSGPVSEDQTSEAKLLHDAVLMIGRARLLNQPLAGEADAFQKQLREKFGPGRTVKILALLGKVTSLPDTMAVYHLAHQILDVLDEEEPEDNADQPDGGDGDADSDQSDSSGNGGEGNGDQQSDADGGNGGQPGDSDADADGDSGGSNGADGQSGDEVDGKSGAPKAGADGEPGKAGDSSSPTQSGDGSGAGLKQKVLSAGKEECDGLKSDLGETVAEVLNQNIDHSASAAPASVVPRPVGSDLLGQETATKGRAAASGLKQVLLGLIQGSRDARPSARRSGKSIDGSRLARVSVGESRIFRKSEPTQRVNAAFQILLDASGSMGGDAMRNAEESVFALLSALEGIQGVSTGAMVFPRTGPGGASSVGVLKRHMQTLNQAVREKRFGIVADGVTPLAEAIWPAAGDLLAAKGQRKVLVVITDGAPDSPFAASEMVTRCRESGIDVLCIAFGAIREATLNAVFGRGAWRFLPDKSQLRNALDQLVRDVLTQTAA
ncbi:VWA domain-containing protein [Pseudomonas aeruginosa]|uniref:VWA domain-containing protein n=1 Tax=Pseudomonas aeruginosa TaxID=287 RepID=UPI000B5A9947|nr:VWA domain-containing protein [Pseudomonas aeruginosa]ASJ88524.1 cobaltochelatase, CobT subunit [Pseudomonas aeruginosa]MCO3750046.1 VWA domain-containing protein [Pseudomonas aeruginosa]